MTQNEEKVRAVADRHQEKRKRKETSKG